MTRTYARKTIEAKLPRKTLYSRNNHDKQLKIKNDNGQDPMQTRPYIDMNKLNIIKA